MQPNLKKILRALSLDIRHTLEGSYDSTGVFHPGDLETRLNELGVWRERTARPLAELPHLSAEDRAARQVIDAYIAYRAEAGVERAEAVAEFVREAAYNWTNRLLALRCMEARGIIDEVVLQKTVYGGRSMVHNRLAKKDPQACAGPDEGLFVVLLMEFQARAEELPELFAPKSPAISLRPSLPALKRVVGLLSGTLRTNGQEAVSDEVFSAPDALGWAYQYWNTEEKDRIFEKVRTQKGARIEGADIIPATQLYTEPYMVKFLVQNSLGALWMSIHPYSTLFEDWEYYVKDADSTQVECKPVQAITLLDPACGSGHFLLEAFDLLFHMYQEEDSTMLEDEIAAAILNHNLYGIDIDERAVQISAAALWMKAKEVAPNLSPAALISFHHHLVATNIRLPKGKNHVKAFLAKHPESVPLQPALDAIFEGLENVHELGSLVQLEEPVEKELRYLRNKYEGAKKRGIQPNFFEQITVQGELPIGVESYDEWKYNTLSQLEQHFIEEGETAEAVQSFFGESAQNGLILFEILARRYDVVCANPPYMGSKNMDNLIKAYVDKNYPKGKADLYTAFILRCISLCAPFGKVSMVTRKIWMFLKTFENLRQEIIDTKQINIVCDLGSRAFDPEAKLHDGVDCALFILSNNTPSNNRVTGIRLIAYDGPDEKETALVKVLSGKGQNEVYQVPQNRFSEIDGMPFVYWLIGNLSSIFTSPQVVGDIAKFGEGLGTRNDARFVRRWWECDTFGTKWFRFVKGGGYCKWWGLNYFAVNYYCQGSAIKQSIIEKYPYLQGNFGWLVRNEDLYFSKGLTFTDMSARSLGVRFMPENSIFTDKGPGIVPEPESLWILLSFLNSRIATFGLRCLTPTLQFRSGYIQKVGVPELTEYEGSQTEKLAKYALICKRYIKDFEITEFDSDIYSFPQASSLVKVASQVIISLSQASALLHFIEGLIERNWLDIWKIGKNEESLIIDETGTPSAWHPYVLGYNQVPNIKIDPFNNFELSTTVESQETTSLSDQDLKDLKKKVFSLLNNISSVTVDEDIEQDEIDEEDLGAFIPIPSETTIEELSIKLKVNPVSVFQMIKEGIEGEGWRCPSEEKRLTKDIFSILILRLLGHRWPKQIEANESIPAWADVDGIIPLTPGLKDLSLLDRLLERIPEQFPGGSVAGIEREFAEIMGEPLEKWLSRNFFKSHISQFKKRPIIWQLISQSASGKSGKGKAKKGLDKAPAFSCLVYYQKLNVGTLTTIKSQYVSPLRQSYETELRTLEAIVLLAPEQSSRRLQLEAWIDELKVFEDRLERCAREGFASPALAQVAAKEAGAKEPLDHWVSRDGQAQPPANRAEFEAQEMRYDPDLNDGVRVNIAPLQKYGLLAADVLDAKDIEKAIADRAEWRADERRWCRDGKLPKPGWWK